jgi:predicted CXXCH cytochrome family protein
MRSDFRFDHRKETGYTLEGAHATAACLRCHNDRGPIKAYVSRGCGGCHADPHKATMGQDCQRCHNSFNWGQVGRQGEKVATHARTRFPLTGMHAVISCEQCHTRASAGEFQAVAVDCIRCHQPELSRGPGHLSANFPRDCKGCHTTSTWVGAAFNHNALGSNPNCYGCHQSNFQGVANPNHVALNYSQNCANCHTTSTWLGANFNHAALGANPVCYTCHQPAFASANATPASNHTGNTFPTTCQNCHTTTVWGPGTAMQHAFVGSKACFDCHSTNFTGAPNHIAQNFSHNCLGCHSGTSTWLGAVFDHTPFGANPVCYNCHQAVFASAAPTPASKHAANVFPTTCQNCHTTALWGPGTTMQHAFVGAKACFDCHSANFTSAPNHVAMNFSHACLTCHSGTATWLGAVFDHTALGANPVCYNCHQAVYASAAVTPSSRHAANAFPTTCQNCHTTALWGPGTAMQHSFVGSTCQTCHIDDYNAATSPVGHAAQGIPSSACNTCHTTFVNWTGFIHNPSNCFNSASSNSHHNAKCSQCHAGANYATATCTACHANRGNSCN